MNYGFLLGLCLVVISSWAQQAPDTSLTDTGVSQPVQPTVEAINQKTEMLRNPGWALDNTHKINDPTQMTGSFTQALGRVQSKGGQTTAPAAVAVPDLQLIARFIRGENHKTALIGIDGKSYMVKEGGQFNFLSGQNLYEVQVNKIDKEQVELTVLPIGKRVILQ